MASPNKNRREIEGRTHAIQVRTRMVDASIMLAGAALFSLGIISTQVGQARRRVQELRRSRAHTPHTA